MLVDVYCPLVKWDKNPDGTVNAFGRATSDDLDLDKQICDPGWLNEAMPEWFKSAANVREQHSNIAAGVGTELVQRGNGWDLKSLVVDPASAKKVEHGVLKGYSIGIRNPKVVKDATAPGGRIIGGQIVEVSLVDRPANPTCTLTLAKSLKPGPLVVTPGTVDHERSLVKVEELHEDVAPVEPAPAGLDELHDALKALDLVAVVKGDQARDIRDAEQAIAIIAGLIQSEAAQLAGDTGYEACDIGLLLDAVRALSYFKCRERKEPAMAHVDLSAEADVEKSAAPDAAPAAAPAEAPVTETPEPVEKAAAPAPADDEDAGKHDLTELVKALGAEVGSLKEQLTKALSAPAPGGPVLTRTAQDATKSDARDELLAKAARYDRQAEEMRDPQARAGYLQLAAQARGQAATS